MTFASQLSFVSAAGAAGLAAGALLRSRRRGADWALAAGMIALGAEAACAGWAARPPFWALATIHWQRMRLLAASCLPGFWLWFSLSYARGNAREFLGRWGPALAAAFVLPIGLVAAGHGQLIVSLRAGRSGSFWLFGLGWPGIVLHLFLLVGSILILMNLERTFRASVGTMRWRIKFMLMAVGLLFVVRVYTAIQALLFREIDTSLDVLDAATLLLASLLALRSFFRAGRAGGDVYPSHSALQGSATVLLAGIYLLVVGVCAKGVAVLGGPNVFALEAFLILLSLVLLVILLQSDRLRLRLGRFVSRHFQRPLHDYRTVWKRFTEISASPADQIGLCRSLVKLVADVFQTLSVAIWLVDDKTLTLAASTSLSAADSRELALTPAEAGELLAYFQEHPEPVDIESSQSGWAAALRRIHPSEFPGRENRACLPIIVRGRVAALMILGDRVGGAALSTQDFDLLACVGDHAAANLLNAQLAQNLLQARELEAFQAMAAFFVHDLKNAAATLSLMLENLPAHFEDPAFREDALRGVAKSVAHINHIVGRLSLLRSELKILPVDADFNAAVGEAVAGLESDPDFLIVKNFSPLPRLRFDREQISKVVTNLVLNAKESMSGKGRVRVATSRDDGWAVLAVTDTGCGMSSDFIARSLFRPFQTTKRNGLGIGMFQSRMIVEVHGGRIAVASKPGEGTTFQVFLPVAKLG